MVDEQVTEKKMQIIILGDGAVGKTSILARHAGKEFNPQHLKTIGKFYSLTSRS